jgi:hypothetical protein
MVKLDGNTTGDEVVKAFAAEAKGKACMSNILFHSHNKDKLTRVRILSLDYRAQ